MASGAIVVEQDVPVPLRDGCVTRADLWRDPGVSEATALLVRTPYGRQFEVPTVLCEPRALVPAGFAVVVQDVRGRGASDGRFQPFSQEGADGYDSIEWIARQPWCDGRVCLLGSSYCAALQWLAAATRPPSLAAIAPAFGATRFGEGWMHRGGVPELAFVASWIAGLFGEPSSALWLDDVERSYQEPAGLIEIAPWSEGWLAGPGGEPAAAEIASVEVPAYVVGGFSDIFLGGTIESYNQAPCPGSRLLLGPWGHDEMLSHLIGERNVGFAGSGEGAGYPNRFIAFLSAILAGEEPPGPPVRAYLAGARSWLDLECWPPERAGRLGLEVAGGEIVYDPAHPPPSIRGRCLTVGTAGGSGYGIGNQRSLLHRADVLSLPLPPLAAGADITGPVRARMETVTEGDELCDWVCTLCVEAADGRLDNLCEGVLRAPAGAAELEIDLGHVCIRLEPGSQLMLLIAGASHPRFSRLERRRRQRVMSATVELTVS